MLLWFSNADSVSLCIAVSVSEKEQRSLLRLNFCKLIATECKIRIDSLCRSMLPSRRESNGVLCLSSVSLALADKKKAGGRRWSSFYGKCRALVWYPYSVLVTNGQVPPLIPTRTYYCSFFSGFQDNLKEAVVCWAGES